MEVVKKAFRRKEKEAVVEGRFMLYAVEEAKPGFAFRGNSGDEKEKERGELAENQAMDFLGGGWYPRSSDFRKGRGDWYSFG